MDSVRDRLDIPRFWWRGAEPAPVRTAGRPRTPGLTLANPLPHPHPHPGAATALPQARSGGRNWLPVTAATALMLGVLTFITVSRIGGLSASTPLSARIDDLMIMAGLGVEEIHVSGHRYTNDNDIFAALELGTPTSLLRYNPEAARRRVAALSWVKRATVTRVLPNAVEVRVSERAPIALWLNGQGASLVDIEGRELARVPPSTLQALPRIAGDGAPEAVAPLLAALGAHPALQARVQVAERVGQRRWSLKLDNGSRVHLPAEDEVAALDRLMQRADSADLLGAPDRVVDLRVEDRIAVAPRAGTQTSSAQPASAAAAVRRRSASAL